ncbi:hypothetical protein TraAM80_02840 [Trypanosoma rangeli]|uniref:PRA1 family protein n=1 Tax=Trypanosoma rangeli TaxID=5698 RepID=A0A3R7KKP1_TRYRA|nr:uncharacterized protein TraAM80_02840 [Trypanosoma rangeli]RNF08380.1 hypothetical protein TraAM80_02840 [Trypanosoma rangeli]|eukprot:RNF08380.1 hypothetical protein TraAM80_02840 [Trypanosoma rangeli]
MPALDETITERKGSSQTNFLTAFSALWGASLEQPQRPLWEFFQPLVVPTREVYTTHLLVNLLWFARNYYNLALLISCVLAIYMPPYTLIVIVSCIMHVMKRYTFRKSLVTAFDTATPTRQENGRSVIMMLLMLLQICCCIYTWSLTGLFSIVMCVVAVATPIVFHAFFTPYTDEAFKLYYEVLRARDLPPPMPRSPTCLFCSVDPEFDVRGNVDAFSVSSWHLSSEKVNRRILSRSFPAPRRPLKESNSDIHCQIQSSELIDRIGQNLMSGSVAT